MVLSIEKQNEIKSLLLDTFRRAPLDLKDEYIDILFSRSNDDISLFEQVCQSVNRAEEFDLESSLESFFGAKMSPIHKGSKSNCYFFETDGSKKVVKSNLISDDTDCKGLVNFLSFLSDTYFNEYLSSLGVEVPDYLGRHVVGASVNHVMSYVKGINLERIIRPVEEEAVFENYSPLNVALGVCKILVDYEALGFVHGDLSPAQFILSRDDVVGTDYGFSRFVSAKNIFEDLLFIYGTCGYLAPEVFGDFSERIDNKEDIFSAGMIIAELLGAENYQRFKIQYLKSIYWESEVLALDSHILFMDDFLYNGSVKELLYACTEINPKNRPTALEMNKVIINNLSN